MSPAFRFFCCIFFSSLRGKRTKHAEAEIVCRIRGLRLIRRLTKGAAAGLSSTDGRMNGRVAFTQARISPTCLKIAACTGVGELQRQLVWNQS